MTTCKQNDIICLSQKFLDSSIKITNNRLNIDLLGVYLSGNNKRKGVCMY